MMQWNADQVLAWTRLRVAWIFFQLCLVMVFVGLIGYCLGHAFPAETVPTKPVVIPEPVVSGVWIEVHPPGQIPGEHCWVLSVQSGYAGVWCR